MQQFAVFIICLGLIFFSPHLNQSSVDGTKLARSPASPQTCLELLRNFYPHQSDEFILNRIKANKDVHSFYRAFVPLYYKEFQDNPKLMQSMGELNSYKAMMGGDVHFENFGLIITDQKKILFTLNDFDDATEGPLYMDVYRHFVSANFVDKKIKWDDYLSAYLDGIKNEKRIYSIAVQSLIDDAQELSQNVILAHVSKNPPYKFIKLKKPNRALSSTEAKNLKTELSKIYPQIEIFDHYARIKTDGGSAGMLRFQVLARLNPKEEVRWLDIKELSQTSFDKVFNNLKTINPGERIKKIKDHIYDSELNNGIKTLLLSDKTFSLRFMDQFAIGVDLSDIDKEALVDVALDEAYALGVMHSQMLKKSGLNSKHYAEIWEKQERSSLKETVDHIDDTFKELYKESL